MSESTPPSLLPAYRDRRAGLMTFGVLSVLIGVLCALFIPLLLLGSYAARRSGTVVGAEMHPSLPATTYGVVAVVAIWLGIGSINTRRWARALLLSLSWIALAMGAVVTVLLAFTLRGALAAASADRPISPGELLAGEIVALSTVVVCLILVPIAFVWFYSQRDVRLTCEARDPLPRWTDRCPTPVLIACLLLAWTGVSLVWTARLGQVFPIAGHLLRGAPARALFILSAAFALFAAWGFYRLNRRIWTACLALAVLIALNNLVTLARVEPAALLGRNAETSAQIRRLSPLPWLHGPAAWCVTLAGGAAAIGYLLAIRRHFIREA